MRGTTRPDYGGSPRIDRGAADGARPEADGDHFVPFLERDTSVTPQEKAWFEGLMGEANRRVALKPTVKANCDEVIDASTPTNSNVQLYRLGARDLVTPASGGRSLRSVHPTGTGRARLRRALEGRAGDQRPRRNPLFGECLTVPEGDYVRWWFKIRRS